jgi:ABC-type transporter Mla MlaB component
MALFSKPPAKKPDPPKTDPRPTGPRPVSAREVAAQAAGRNKAAPPKPAAEPTGDITVTGASLVDWSAAAQPAIEVAQANPGLCSVLENAALMYASGQAQQARALLDHGISSDQDAKLSPLAWLALFDLLQRANDRAAFDQLAMQFVMQFERSAPAWEERTAAAAAPRTLLSRAVSGGYVAVTGMLTAGLGNSLEGLRKAVEKRSQARVDLSQVTGFDDSGARELSELLARARKQRMDLQVQRPEKLHDMLEAAVKKGKDGGEAAWLLSLELMQWQHDQAAFDDRAVEFAITFELSPPSWEPPPEPPPEPKADAKNDAKANGATAAPGADDAAAEATGRAREQTLAWSGVLTGSAQRALVDLTAHSANRHLIAIDMTDVERIDFVCAGALLNHINRIEAQRKSVQISGASPIIRALLLLIGISPRHFVRKSP